MPISFSWKKKCNCQDEFIVSLLEAPPYRGGLSAQRIWGALLSPTSWSKCLTTCWFTGIFMTSQPALGFTKDGATCEKYTMSSTWRVWRKIYIYIFIIIYYIYIFLICGAQDGRSSSRPRQQGSRKQLLWLTACPPFQQYNGPVS